MTQARILIVEDDPDTAHLLETWLRASHYQHVGTAASGQEAIAQACSTKPDLIIMDIVLQGEMDGIEAARILRERFDIPVLYLTAFTDDVLFARARTTSPAAYLIKPFNEQELGRAIDVALDRHVLLQRLKASEAHLAEAQAVARIGSWHWDLMQDQVTASNEMLRLFDLAHDTFEPRFESFLQCIHADDQPKVLQAVETWLGGGEPGDIVININRVAGRKRILRLQGKAHFDAAGKAIEIVGTAHDITDEWLARQEAALYRSQLETKVAERTASLTETANRLQSEIAKHLKTEARLEHSEARYRSLVEKLPDTVIVTQNDRVIYANPAALRLAGVQNEHELLGKSVMDLVHSDTQQLFEQRKQAALASGERNPLIAYSILRSDGSAIEVESVSFAFEYDGQPAFLIVMHDLTQRRSIERAAERFRIALDSSPDAIFLIDPSAMRFIDANVTACNSLGYSRAELLARGPHDIKPHFNKTSLGERFEQVLSGQKGASTIQTIHQRKDGSTFPVEVSLRPFESEGRQLMVVIARDTSERHLAETQLQEANERFLQFAENISDVFWVRDLEENRVLYVNPAYETLFQKPVSTFYRHPRSFLGVVHPDDQNRVASLFAWQLQHRQGIEIEYRIVVANDAIRWIWVRTFPIKDKQGKVYRMAGIAEDITQRRESEEQYRSVIQASMDGFVLLDMQGQLLDCNDAYCNILGYDRDELLRCSISDLDKSESPEQVAEHIRLIRERGHDRFETQHVHKNGQLIDVEISAHFKPDSNGGTLFAFLRDISLRKQAEIDLRESEQRYRSLIANLPGIAYRCALDADWTVEVFSGATDSLIGYPASDFLEKRRSFASVIHPDDTAMVDRMVREGVARKQRFEIDYRICRSDGRIVNVHENGHAVFDEKGKVRWLDGLISDVTDQKQAEAALLRSEARSRSILRAAPVGIGMLINRVFQEVNDAMTTMTGYAPEELIGQSARMLYPTQAEFDHVGTEKYQQIETHGIGSVETRWLRKDGRIIDVLLSSSPIEVDDLSQGVTFTALDITAAKQAEQARMEHETRQRNALVREVHHRIKNNLQGVIILLRQHISSHPEIQPVVEAAIAQVNTVAVVHGLQSRMPQRELRLRELLHEVKTEAAAMAMMPSPAINDTLLSDVWLDSGSVVTIALILNELIQNAFKHGHFDDEAGVTIVLGGNGKLTRITIRNPGGPLPADLDLVAGTGCGTGLDLIHTLLPNHGAQLNLYQDGGMVHAELVLSEPVIHETRGDS